ncbi:uncharacterized protein LOC129569732 [Sitodiplosis mosellana]|uniref:uncharacterized protein LOC129569732 n=1 Tax=Sitodiplosis mosellana TaxID=263140 RepID=UPI002444E2C2|nr:uncharacterized protein LOC129569732 [Sitodiplosis mosellana]
MLVQPNQCGILVASSHSQGQKTVYLNVQFVFKISLDVSLFQQNVVIEPNTLEWFCEAKMTATLCSTTTDHQSFRKSLAMVVFKKDEKSHGLRPFIKLADIGPYMQDGRVFFEIQLSVNPLKTRSQTQIETKRLIFQFTLDDVSKFNTKHCVDVSVGGTKWSVRLMRKQHNLAVVLRDERNAQDDNWTWHAKCSFKLLSFDDDNIHPHEYKMERTFYFEGHCWGFPKFIAWNDLMDPANKYIQDDKAVFEVDLEVSPAKPVWDFGREQPQPRPENGILECSICLQNIVGREPVSTKCGHLFCKACIRQSIQENNRCPNCNADAVLLDLRPIYP